MVYSKKKKKKREKLNRKFSEVTYIISISVRLPKWPIIPSKFYDSNDRTFKVYMNFHVSILT